MSETLYPWGYGKLLVPLATLKQLARVDLMEPEYAERLFAWIVSKKGKIGIGSSVRAAQPVGPTFAPEGMSFHQQQKFADGSIWFSAVDLVAKNGTNVHRSPYWSEVPKQGSGHPDISAYGVHCNVNGEPWHMQPIEIDGYQSWTNGGRRRPNPDFKIQGTTTTPAPTPTGPDPALGLGSRVLRLTSPTMHGPDVMWAQNALRTQGLILSADGYYGRQTKDRVMTWQARKGLTADGIVGPKTWAALIDLFF